MMHPERGMYALADGTIINNTHHISQCQGALGGCPLHNPSDHSLRDAPLISYRGRLGRRCEHGQGHPDIDDAEFYDRQGARYYGKPPSYLHEPCDGCCGLDQSYWQSDPKTEEAP